jgi:hypothetical protein
MRAALEATSVSKCTRLSNTVDRACCSSVCGGGLGGRFADLLTVGRVRDNTTVAMDVLDAALIEAGRPLLIVSPRPPRWIGEAVVIAWKITPEAARAVTAALPFLASASRLVILSVTENVRKEPAPAERATDDPAREQRQGALRSTWRQFGHRRGRGGRIRCR